MIKQLLNGAAIGVVFALAMPALAQNLVTGAPSAAPPPAPSTAAPPSPSAAPEPAQSAEPAAAPAEPMARKPVRHRVHHMAKTSRDPEGDQLTQQLNQQVLSGTGGAPPPTPGAGAPPPPMPGPGAPPPPAR